jgi:hypothetical protein
LESLAKGVFVVEVCDDGAAGTSDAASATKLSTGRGLGPLLHVTARLSVDPKLLVPTPDSIPAAAMVFELLEGLTFTIHLLLMNAMLGGSLLAAVAAIRGAKSEPEKPSGLGQSVLAYPKHVPTMIALTINFGVAPLLFVQVTFGHLIYTSSILMAVFWLAVIPVLIIAYYAAYLSTDLQSSIGRKTRLRSTRISRIAAPLSALLLLYVAFVLVNNNTLMLQPERWLPYAENRRGTMLNLADPTLWPRYLHFVLSAVAVAGLYVALKDWWVHRNDKHAEGAKERPAVGRPARKLGLKIFAHTTFAQLIVGFWFLFALPDNVRNAFIGGDSLGSALLALGILTGVGAALMALKDNLQLATILLVGTVVLMVAVRAMVRTQYLLPYFKPESLQVKAQSSPLVLFILILVAAVVLIAWMLKTAAKTWQQTARAPQSEVAKPAAEEAAR